MSGLLHAHQLAPAARQLPGELVPSATSSAKPRRHLSWDLEALPPDFNSGLPAYVQGRYLSWDLEALPPPLVRI